MAGQFRSLKIDYSSLMSYVIIWQIKSDIFRKMKNQFLVTSVMHIYAEFFDEIFYSVTQ